MQENATIKYMTKGVHPINLQGFYFDFNTQNKNDFQFGDYFAC